MSIVPQRGNLVEIVVNKLLARIDTGEYAPGDKLPSSAQLCDEFGVSRTVIREAIASLKLGGRVSVRQGAGAFVAEKDGKAFTFEIDRNDEIRSAMQILELRLGIEMQSVALAALRRTPETLAEITRAYDFLDKLVTEDIELEAKADFDFHLAIARATRNPHFTRFLEAVASEINLDLLLKHRRSAGVATKTYLKKLSSDHAAILTAITLGDAKAARAALTRHLEESLDRYRRLLGETP